MAAAIALPAAAGSRLVLREGATGGAVASGAAAGGSGDPDPTSPFTDVADGSAALPALLWAVGTGVQPALEEGLYHPDTTVTRAEAALALHRLAGTPPVPLEAAPALIADLDPDPARARALLWLHGRGALWGDHRLRVHPGRTATHRCAAQMVTGLVRPALAGLGLGREVDGSPAEQAGSPEGIDPSAVDVRWLAETGMLPAAADPADWDGDRALTREQLALALHRVDGVIAAKTASFDPVP